MRLTEIQVDRYGPLPRFVHACEDNFEVFYGPNESGKTLLLEAILKLLAPDIDSAMPHVDRVDESPAGYVVVETGGTEQKFGDGTVLNDIVDLSPRHLRNIFVIRDSDLRLNDEHEFYDSVTQQIGDLHTSEIEAIQSRLVETGRLTSVKGRSLSSARGNDYAEEVRDEAASLATAIRDYIEEANANDIAAVEREFVAVKTKLQQCADELATQEAAQTLDTHATLTERLNTYTEAGQQLDEDISRTTLETLERLDRDIAEAADKIEDVENQRASLREERTELETEKETVEAELTPLEGRTDDVDDVERALDSFRDAHEASVGASRGMRFAKYVTLGGIGLGGLAAILGSTPAGVLLAVLGAAAAGWYTLQHRAVTATEREREAVLQQARDAGLDVTTAADIGPAIRSFRDDVERLQEQRDELARKIEVKTNLIEQSEEELQAVREERRANREEKRRLLQTAGVADIDAYREQVDADEALERQRDQAAQSLTDRLGEPAGETPSSDEKIRYWEEQLAAMVADIDEDVTADDYDPDRLAELRAEHERLQERHQELDEQLEAHTNQLREFDDRIEALTTQPFLDEPVTLKAHSLEGLRDVFHDVERLVEQIEREADIAREALDIFDGIQAKEEQKITDLFGEESRAAEVFHTITDERYTGVTYDAEAQVLQVHRDGHGVLTPAQLSHGATEQLYLAARIGLAEQLLSSEPGFFLLDDALLPADRTRLQESFEVLQALAADDWQILYFTAKDEVGVDLVDRHGLRCRSLDPLG